MRCLSDRWAVAPITISWMAENDNNSRYDSLPQTISTSLFENIQ
jgi:hypothetical protein